MAAPHVARALLLVSWLWSGAAAPAVAAGPDYGQVRAVVVRVCDGDTVVVDIPEYPDVIGKAIRVRLTGLDAPELRDRSAEIRRAAQAARRAMETLLPPGTAVTLTGIRRDKYFRLDATISLDGRDVATVLAPAPGP
ncbi:thermonuclease family protein [Solidesulfovibrio sp.]